MNVEFKHEGGRAEGKAGTAAGLVGMIGDISKLMTYPVSIKIDEVGATLDYKAILHIWFRSIAKQFTDRDKTGKKYTEQDMHDLMCHLFFGYTEPRTLGRTKIEPALITITYPEQKKRPELYDFCRNIENWCSKVGVTLPENESQYTEDKARENS